MILILGGHYSYAKVPLGFWMEDWFGWTRNNYDKIGHFMQGFGPTIYVREIMARTSPLRHGKWLGFVSIAVPLAFSALYEIIEWLASLSDPTDTEAFLGTQGYIWDTQTDMFWCLIGSTVAIILLTKLHDRYLQKIGII
jgi:putative membrane protein